ncbi:MAG: hypothetical protein WBC91_15660 [Phototrophicaceae bacterium]
MTKLLLVSPIAEDPAGYIIFALFSEPDHFIEMMQVRQCHT